MSFARPASIKLTLCRAFLLAALPTACAVGVEPDFEGDAGDADVAGSSAGGSLGSSGSTSVIPKAGTTSTSNGGSGVANPFGGTSSSGGKAGSSSSGGSSAGGSSSAGSASAGSAGSGGSSAGGASGGTGGGGSGCACPAPKAWADNSNLSFGPGDCVDVAGVLYLYTGAKAQTWANKDCNPTMQLAWCSDGNSDYKFMLCE